MIEIRNLSFAYPLSQRKAVDNVSFVFPETGLFYIVGESGSGKSTFIHLLSGLLSPYQGSLKIDGSEIREMKKSEREELLRKTLSLSLQSDLSEAEESVYDSLALPLEISDIAVPEKASRIASAADVCSLASLLSKKTKELSGGELKRVSLARALVKDTPILLLDEPLGPLDKAMRQRLTEMFIELSKTRLLIIVTHSREEIRKTDNVLSFQDGKMKARIPFKPKASKPSSKASKRRKYSFLSILPASLRMLKAKKRRTLSSLFACILSLCSLGLIFLISEGISSGLKSYLSGTEERNAMEVVLRNKEIASSAYTAASFSDLKRIEAEYPYYVRGLGAYYSLNYEQTFLNENLVFFSKGPDFLYLQSLSARNFGEARAVGELKDEYRSLSDLSLASDQLILSLSPSDLSSLHGFLGLSGENYLSDISSYISSQQLVLHLKVANASFGYRIEELYEVKAVIASEESFIAHTSSFFAESFIEDTLRFVPTSSSDGPFPNPWTVFKAYILEVNPYHKREFLDKIAENPEWTGLTFRQLKSELPSFYRENEMLTQGRIAVFNSCETSLPLADICQIQQTCSSALKSLYLSNRFFYCASQTSTAGFLKPVYVSARRDLLNKIADFNYEAKFDLAGFQGSTIVFDEGVVMGDLSKTQTNPLLFKPYLSPPPLVKGYYPEKSQDVLISSCLADYLYKSASFALNQKLFLTCLKETVFKNGGYKNIFADGEMKVTGVVEDEKMAIYQSPRFLLDFGEDQLSIPNAELEINSALFVFDDAADARQIQKSLQVAYPDFRFSLPMLEMAESIDTIISYVSYGLLSFSLFSGLISSVLMILVLFLFIQEGKERIKTMISLGFSLEDIRSFYAETAFLLGFVALLLSALYLGAFSLFFSYGLEELLGVGFSAFMPEMYLGLGIYASVFTLLSIAFSSWKLSSYRAV
jgi:ABC-type lipoprotein export system ATPase subunit